ncbi:MAG: four helix bundle protein [Bacteroidales bacterium]|nr:four helix bundle protein [Bacteroidales bacterium]
MTEVQNDLTKRLFQFSVDVILLLRKLDNNEPDRLFKYQLGKSATSAGANYEESQAGISRADFTNKVRIALKEMRESNYWLRLMRSTKPDVNMVDEIDTLIIESEELSKILGAIVNRLNKKDL